MPSRPCSATANAAKGLNAFRAFLKENKLALAVVRNVTWRQRDDLQQPFNLSVLGSTVMTKRTGSDADVLDIDHLQVFTGQQLRGTDGDSEANSAENYRRVLAQPAAEILVEDNTGNPRNVNGAAAAGVPVRHEGLHRRRLRCVHRRSQPSDGVADHQQRCAGLAGRQNRRHRARALLDRLPAGRDTHVPCVPWRSGRGRCAERQDVQRN